MPLLLVSFTTQCNHVQVPPSRPGSRSSPLAVLSLLARTAVEQLEAADQAVRVGDPNLGIIVGADDHNVDHNIYMYQVKPLLGFHDRREMLQVLL
jgi:hypothetical protein